MINNFLTGVAVIGVVLAATAAAQPERNGAGGAAAHPVSDERTGVAGAQSGSAMHWMAFNGDVAGVKELIVAGEDVNGRLKTGGTPLHLAAYKGHVEVAKVLIEHGARVDARTREGVTPLDWAQRNGHERVAMLLIAHGAGQPKNKKPSRAPAPVSAEQEKEPPEQGQAQEQEQEQDVSDSVVTEKTAAPSQQSEGEVAHQPTERSDEKAAVTERAEPLASVAGYRIQLGAFSSEQRAREAWEGYRKQFPDQLQGRELIIDRASVKGKEYHRVQTGPMDRQDAWDICDRLKGTGQACAVMRRASP